jgi:hypothetical protein
VLRTRVPSAHSAGRPLRQYSHSPQLIRHSGTTASPARRVVTPGPTSATTPAPSCPSTAGSGAENLPCMTCRSVWHTPAAAMRTSASPARGGATSTSQISSGLAASNSTAPRAFIPRM